MKQELFKRKGGRIYSSLLLKFFALLAVMLVGVNVSWAQTSYGKAEISDAPTYNGGWHAITLDGNVKAWYTNTTTEFNEFGGKEINSKWFVKLAADGFIKIRVTKGTVVAGDILRVELADIYQNADNQDLGFKVEGSGSTPSIKETDNAIHTIDYTLKAGDIRVDPDDNNSDYIQINRNGQYGFNGCGYHSVEILRNILDASNFMQWSDINGNTINKTPTEESIITSLGNNVSEGGTVYGDGNVYYLNYVNVKGGDGAIMPDAKCLIIEGTPGVTLRILANRVSNDGSLTELTGTIPSDGKLIVDISNYDTFHLNAIKIPWNGSKGNVVNTIKLSNALETYTVNVDRTALPANCDAWFTIGSETTQYREAKEVAVGTQVTYTMSSSDPHYTPAGWRTKPWEDPDYGWMGYSASFTTTVRSEAAGTGTNEQRLFGNLNPTPEFKKFFFVRAEAETGGTATVTDASGHNTSESYDNTTGELTFTATPDDGYTFDGWYNTSGKKDGTTASWNYGTYGTANSDVDLVYTAKFTPSTPTTPEGQADFADRGKADVTLVDGVLTSTADHNNWANLFVFPLYKGDSNHKNISKTANNYTGLTVTAQGDAFRLVVYFSDDSSKESERKEIRVESGSNYAVSTFKWADFGLTDNQVAQIRRITIAGTKKGSTTTFKNAYLIDPTQPFVFLNCDEEHTIKVGKTAKISATVSDGSFTTWNLYDADPTKGNANSLGFIGYMSEFTFDPEVGVKSNTGTDLKSGTGDYYFVADAGVDLGEGKYAWANEKYGYAVCHVKVLPKPENVTITYSIPKVFAASVDKSKLTAQWNNNGSWQNVESGSTVPYGSTVRFTADDFANNDGIEMIGQGRLVLQNWKLQVGDEAAEEFKGNIANSGIVYLNDKSSYEMVVDDDITFQAIYGLSYLIHYEGAKNVNNSDGIATYEHGTVSAYIGDEKISEWSGFRANTDVIVKATPADGWFIDHWEGRLVGTEEVWSNNKWANTSTLTFNSSGSFNNAWGQDIYIKPVFKELTYTQTKINVTHDNKTKEREFIVYVPESVANMENVPVLFSLHGTGNDNDPDVYGVQNYKELADSEHFIVVYPRGLMRNFPVFGGDARGWMSDGKYNEDVKFFEDIISWLDNGEHSAARRNCTIDKNRVYMTGFSNGGMMAYSTAFTSDKFAAFSSVSGLQLNEFHLQHHGGLRYEGDVQKLKRTLTPFIHIHGTKDDFVKYTLMPTIVDNMVYRNGCNPIPTVTTGDANVYGTATQYKRSEYTSTIDANVKYVYYEIGTGMTDSDTGMGHNPECGIDSENSKSKIWNFLKDYTLSSTPATGLKNYSNADNIVFKPMIEKYTSSTNAQGVKEFEASDHGWTMYQGKVLAQYGDVRKSTNDKQYVYHTIQLSNGWHTIKFNASCTNPLGRFLTVRIERVATFDKATNEVYPLSTPKKVVDDETYSIDGTISHSFWINESSFDMAEYRLTIIVEDQDKLSSDQFDASGFPKDPIVISGIELKAKSADEEGTHCDPPVSTDFKGYFNYHNRLMAQWNFDLADNNRCNTAALEANSQYWTADYSSASADHKYGTIVYSYNKGLDDQQLTYDGNTLVPVAAGLKFYGYANQVKIQVSVHAGETEKVQLVVEKGVRMYIPYVRNSFRNDKGIDLTPSRDDQYYPEEMTADWLDCIHHINRDIVYFNSTPDIWRAIDNHPYEDGQMKNDLALFNSGGYDFVDGKTWAKCNFDGTQGKPCIVTFKQTVTFDRIGVNRNLIYSFYTENISADTGYDRPFSGLRVIGTPRGAKIANVGATYSDYSNAIAMTYGGWKYNGNQYKDFSGNSIDDKWSELTVYGEYADINYGDNNENLQYDKVPIATDGFPVFSSLPQPAHSETLNPTASASTDKLSGGQSYHDRNDGTFLLTKADGGSYDDIENLTPWSLPTRGSYAKFEPTLPGVLNVHILQEKGKVYYIADEFGHLVKENVFTKAGTGQTVNDNTNGKKGHFSITRSDNVKYSFDVYPGKTYYLFSNTGKMAIAGFNFEPYVYRKYHSDASVPNTEYNKKEAWEMDRNNVTLNTASINENTGYTKPADLDWQYWSEFVDWYSNQTASVVNKDDNKPKHKQGEYKSGDGVVQNEPMTLDNRAVHVKYTRGFAKNQWATICLPFSMNNLQLQEQFGDGVKVLLLRDVQEVDPVTHQCTANFIYHMNQDIIAGYPYLIYPTKEGISQIEANVYVSEEKNSQTIAAGGAVDMPSLISINGKGQNTVTYPVGGYTDNYYVANNNYNYGGMNCYEWKGLFTGETAPMYSYVISKNTGKLTRLTSATSIKPFRAYLTVKDPAPAAKSRIQATNYMDVEGLWDTTDIEDMLLEQGIVGGKTNVYNLNGQIIRANTDDLSNLPKGVYIVNGKKYFVK